MTGTRHRERGKKLVCYLAWAAGYPLAEGAGVFTELMNGGLHPVKALLRP